MWYPLARARRACAGTLKLFFYYHPNLYQTRSQMRQCLPFPFSLFKPQHDEIGSKRRGRGGAPCAPVYREGRSGARRRVRGLSPLYRAPAVTAIQLQWSIRAHTPQGGRRPCVEWLSAPQCMLWYRLRECMWCRLSDCSARHPHLHLHAIRAPLPQRHWWRQWPPHRRARTGRCERPVLLAPWVAATRRRPHTCCHVLRGSSTRKGTALRP